MHSGCFFNIHLLSCIFVTHVPTRPLNPHTDLLCSSGWTQFFTGLLPRQNFSPPPLGRSYPPADAEIFLLRLSHKDGIKKVENTSALAFSLQTAGMIRRQSCCKVNMQLIEVDIRYLRHELQLFPLPKSFR